MIILSLVSFLCTYPINFYSVNKAENLNKSIKTKRKIVDSLRYQYNLKMDKQLWFFNKYYSKFDPADTKYNTREKLWIRLDDLAIKDSIKFKWEKIWNKELVSFNKELGFETPEIFKTFVEQNRIDNTDINNYNQSLNHEQEIYPIRDEERNIENRQLSFKQQLNVGIESFIIFFILLFGVRYLFYAIIWSVKIIKLKHE